MNPRTAAIAGAIATLLAGATVPTAPAAPAPTLTTLKNGLRVVLAPDSAATAVDLAVWYAVGIGAEGQDALGARHLTERLMFRGTANVPDGEFARGIAATGGTANTQLQLDYSCFFETLPAEALGDALALEADRMAGLKPSPQAFEEARRQTLADVRGRAARPVAQRALTRLGEAVYGGTPYARPVEGSEGALAKMTPATAQAWRRTHYGPEDAVLTVVGRFDPQATLAVVHRLFDPLPRGGAAAPSRTAARPAGGRRLVQHDPAAPVRLLLVGWRLPGMADPDAPAIEMLAAALGMPDSSGFAASMMQRFGSATFAQSGLDRHRDASMLWTITALNADADTASTELQVSDLVGALRRDPLPGPELDRVRARWTTGELLRLQTTRARAQALGDALLQAGDLAAEARRQQAIASVTPADLQRVAGRVFADDARSVVWVLPQGGAR